MLDPVQSYGFNLGQQSIRNAAAAIIETTDMAITGSNNHIFPPTTLRSGAHVSRPASRDPRRAAKAVSQPNAD